MKLGFALFASLALLALAAAVPLTQRWLPEEPENLEDLWEPAGPVTEEHLERFKRATCDLFSFQSKWVTPNHAACAAHCLIKGYKGGNCKGTICHCRDRF